MFLIFDTETTGLPLDDHAPIEKLDNWPRVIQLAWQLHDEKGDLLSVENHLIYPEGFEIPRASEKVHRISTELAQKQGKPIREVLDSFDTALKKASSLVGHNIGFDTNVLAAEYIRAGRSKDWMNKQTIDTKEEATEFCALPGGKGGKYKWPSLEELHQKLFQSGFSAAHNAAADVEATARCFFELLRLAVITPDRLGKNYEFLNQFRVANPAPIEPIGLKTKAFTTHIEKTTAKVPEGESSDKNAQLQQIPFTHLHVHTQYSILDGATGLKALINKAAADGMKSVAITDHGSMFGVKEFHNLARKNGIKPIIGCEVYVARRSLHQKENKLDASGDHLVLLAKNKTGYYNLVKMVSLAWLEGMYYKPRIDKELLRQHKEGLIALTACLAGEVPQALLNRGEAVAEELILEYKEMFGDDFYLELQRHKSGNPEMDEKIYDDQVYVNDLLVKLGKKHGIKYLATNDVHFLEATDADAHDRLICISTGKDLDDPNRMRYTRQEWFKTQDEMRKLFADLPEAIENTRHVAEKVEVYDLNNKPIMPAFKIPEGFENADDYLRHITLEGARFRYGELTEKISKRIDFELNTIKRMGFPNYFLIVWDFLKAAREMDVSVGPGRGSAAGSVVSYCLRITEIDPLKYNLLFERFLNPDRISMPDIDIDFDEDGRAKVLDWVVKKYGKKRVAHIITFGSMAAKSAIRDVARVQGLPLPESDRLAKLVPERPGVSLKEAFAEVAELKSEKENGAEEVKNVLESAEKLEGSIRNTGTHACGVIIGRDDLEKIIPIATAKESELTYVTQYDGKHVEDIGLLKMDFLGLKTLSIIKDAVENIKKSHNKVIDVAHIPLDDPKTYELYSRGETTALFQFESDGMKKYLKELKPTRFEDLIAMNALYRPGPMEHIPEFIERKHNPDLIKYELPVMEEHLKETYGITVYQEQVMLLARKMAGFTRGESDSLRKAMGKKIKSMMDKLETKFYEGCANNGLPEDKVKGVWKNWEAFAKYAFNKSHATCYSYLSYQTAWLKANYPAEFMAAVLSRNLSDISKITFLIDETRHMGIAVKGPDINESALNFTVDKAGDIRFGLGAIKGVGGAAVEHIVEERNANGHFQNIYDFAKRVNLRTVNKRAFEALALSGAFDAFENTHRAQYFHKDHTDGPAFLEKVIRHVQQIKEREDSAQVSLFAASGQELRIENPPLPVCEPWPDKKQLLFEKEITGFYISGHPLDEYTLTMDAYCNITLDALQSNIQMLNGKKLTVAGLLTDVQHRESKNGKAFGLFVLEDFSSHMSMTLFAEDYLKYRHLLDVGNYLLITGMVKPRFRDEKIMQYRIQSIWLLDEAIEKLSKELILKLDLQKMDDKLVNTLYSARKEYKGNCRLKVMVSDSETNENLLFAAENSNVHARAFLNHLKKSYPALQFELN